MKDKKNLLIGTVTIIIVIIAFTAILGKLFFKAEPVAQKELAKSEEASIAPHAEEPAAEESEAPEESIEFEEEIDSPSAPTETPDKVEPVINTNKPQLFPDTKIGDLVTFGQYEQDNNSENKKEPISWRILEIKDNKALLISEKILLPRYYDSMRRKLTWESSALRSWLNSSFLNDAFSVVEQMQVIESVLVNGDNPEYGFNGGNNTKDRVFLLSINEAEKYFAKRSDRTAQATDFAKKSGLGPGYVDSSPYYGNYSWWLRSPGNGNDTASIVYGDGYVINAGEPVNKKSIGVRPALWVNMDLVVEEITYTPIANAAVDQIVTYGRYEQDNYQENGREPLKWRVLAVEDGKALLVSEKNLVARRFGGSDLGTNWEKCSLRKWLNETFWNNAFTSEEQASIAATLLINEDNEEYEIDGGNNTEDRIFILSFSEVQKYFNGEEDREVKPTEYASANNGNAFWWLRTPGSTSRKVMVVNYNGSIDTSGNSATNYNASVRPAFWINLQQ